MNVSTNALEATSGFVGFFKNDGRRHLGYLKFRYVWALTAEGSRLNASPCQIFAAIGQTVAEIW